MSLNQITSPNSTLDPDIYAKTFTVPDFGGLVKGGPPPDLNDTGVVSFSAELLGAIVNDDRRIIRSHYVKYGNVYTIMVRARFVSGDTDTTPPLLFKVNIPGFRFANSQAESAPVVKYGSMPRLVNNYYALAAYGVEGNSTIQIIALDATGVEPVDVNLANAAGQFYDLFFTMVAVSE